MFGTLLSPGVLARNGRTVRQGKMSRLVNGFHFVFLIFFFFSDEMRLVHQLMDTITDDGDMDRLVVLDPPVSMSHRVVAVRCNLGSNSYCPGETLFR